MQDDNQSVQLQQPNPILQPTPQIKKNSLINNKLLILGVIVIVIFLISGLSLMLLGKNINKDSKTPLANLQPTISQAQQSKSLSNLLREEDVDIKGVLVPFVAHFDDLKATDLPSTFDTRFFAKYKNNYLIAGTGGIQEYDLFSKRLVRTQDKRIFDCNHSFTIIGDYLYAACNSSYSEKKSFASKGRSIYKIDLKTGNAVKRYFEYKVVPNPENTNVQNDFPDFTNINIASLGQTIWGGVENGIFSIDTTTDNVNYYTEDQLGFESSCPWLNIWSNEKYVWAIPQASHCKAGVSVFDLTVGKWKNYSSADIQKVTGPIDDFGINNIEVAPEAIYLTGTWGIGSVDRYIIKYNANAKNWDLLLKLNNSSASPSSDFRQYYPDAYAQVDKQKEVIKALGSYNGVSSLINGKYYLAGDKIYTLRKNAFPESFLSIDLTPNNLNNIYVTKDEKYMLAQDPGMGMNYKSDMLLVNLKDGKRDSLLTGNLVYDKLSDADKSKIDAGIIYVYEELGDVIVVKDDSGNKLFTVNLTGKTLSF